MSDSDILLIDGDIKTQFSPVQANTHFFTFKNKTGTERLGIFPKMNSVSHNDISLADENIESIISQLPELQIREFMPSSKLDQLISTLGKFMEGFAAGSTTDGDMKIDTKQLKNFWTAVWDELKSGSWLQPAFDTIKIPKIKSGDLNIVKIPYTMYYTLLTTTTTNYYTLPFTTNEILKTNGAAGWEANKQFGFAGTTTNSMLGKALNILGSDITINASPIWKAGQYDNSECSIQFDLFNDCAEHAVANYKFINTIFPNNLWMQYNIRQQSPDLYDIKLAGFARYFMCTGVFSLSTKGVMRKITNETSLGAKIAAAYNQKLGGNPLHTCYIPDVYTVKLDFKSLLPNNFNNYIFNYIATSNVYYALGGTQESSYGALTKGLGQSMDKIVDLLKGQGVLK